MWEDLQLNQIPTNAEVPLLSHYQMPIRWPMEQAELGSSKCRAVDSQLNGHALEAKTLLQLTLKPHQGKTQRKWMGASQWWMCPAPSACVKCLAKHMDIEWESSGPPA